MSLPTHGDLKHLAARPVNHEFLAGLEVFDDKDTSMPGGFVITDKDPDPRVKVAATKRQIDFVRHVATLYHRPTKTFYVAFKETVDGLLWRQQDAEKFPKWLFDTAAKQAERSVYIHVVKPDGIKRVKDGRVNQLDDWLDAIRQPWVFDSIAYFLMQNGIISEEMYRGIE